MSELTYYINTESETPDVNSRFRFMLGLVRCEFEEKGYAVVVPEEKSVAMMNLLTNIRNNRK